MSLLSAPTPRPIYADATEKTSQYAILSGSLKLITSKVEAPELYNIMSDPQEEHNLYSKDDPTGTELLRHLDTWVAVRPRLQGPARKLDPASVERLKSLGYVQ